MDNVDKPKQIDYKGMADLVTSTDRESENAILDVIRKAFPDHAILGEEGGVSGINFGNCCICLFEGKTQSDYLWCVDPLDGTTNFAHGYPSFSVSVAVLRHAVVLASCIIEFTGLFNNTQMIISDPGGVGLWNTRTYTAYRNGGAFANDVPIQISRIKEIEKSLLVSIS